MQRIRVLVLTSFYPPHAIGGYEYSCGDTVEWWRAGGIDVTVLTGAGRLDGVADPPGERGVERRLTCFYGDGPGTPPPPGRVALGRALLRDRVTLWRTVRRVRPDVVSVWHPRGTSLTLLHQLARTGIPIVFVVCDYWPVYAPATDPTVRLLGWPGFGEADLGAVGTWVFCSDALRDRVVDQADLSFARTDVVWLGVDLGAFPLQAPRPRPWGWRLAYIGRVSPEKGVHTAVRALAQLPAQATLDVVGYCAAGERARLEKLAAELGVGERLRFDVVSRHQLAGRYADADVVVFPSEWDEPFGIVPLEAMACATPVVASGTGGAGEYLRDGDNCVLFPAGDPAALAAAVRRLAEADELRAAVLAGGARTAARITTERLATRLLELHRGEADRRGS